SPDCSDQRNPADRRDVSVAGLVPPWYTAIIEEPGVDPLLAVPLQSGEVIEHRVEAVVARLVPQHGLEEITRGPKVEILLYCEPQPFGHGVVEKTLPGLADGDQR